MDKLLPEVMPPEIGGLLSSLMKGEKPAGGMSVTIVKKKRPMAPMDEEMPAESAEHSLEMENNRLLKMIAEKLGIGEESPEEEEAEKAPIVP